MGAPQIPQNSKIRGFGGPQTTPKNIFWDLFYNLIFLFVLSAFQGCFTFHFHRILKGFYGVFKKNHFFLQHLGIFRVFYIVKSVPRKCCGRGMTVHFRRGMKSCLEWFQISSRPVPKVETQIWVLS